MVKSYLFLFISFILLSCGKSGGGNNEPSKSTSASFSSQNVPNEAFNWDAHVKMLNFNQEQEGKVEEAIELIKKVIATDEFREKILNHKYDGKKTFVNNNGLTNAQIYQKILEGSEKLDPEKNNAMDVTLETYYVSANVIGYTLPSVNKIWMNRKYLNNFTPVQVSSNLFHEWLHKLGFKHDYERTARRPYSVPYAVGYLMKSLATKYYN